MLKFKFNGRKFLNDLTNTKEQIKKNVASDSFEILELSVSDVLSAAVLLPLFSSLSELHAVIIMTEKVMIKRNTKILPVLFTVNITYSLPF